MRKSKATFSLRIGIRQLPELQNGIKDQVILIEELENGRKLRRPIELKIKPVALSDNAWRKEFKEAGIHFVVGKTVGSSDVYCSRLSVRPMRNGRWSFTMCHRRGLKKDYQTWTSQKATPENIITFVTDCLSSFTHEIQLQNYFSLFEDYRREKRNSLRKPA